MYKRIKEDMGIIVLMLVIRLVNANYNWIQIWPDEHMQLLEPAYNDVFGQGVLTWEWNKNYPIRSPFMILVVSMYYWVLKVTGLDYSFLVAYGVRYFMILPLTVVFDYHMILMLRMLFPKNKHSNLLSMIVIIFNNSNEFTIRFMTRSFYNTFECIFNAITIYWWFKSGQQFLRQKPDRSVRWEVMSRILTSINFMIRPSCVIIWPICYILRMVIQIWTYYRSCGDYDSPFRKYTSFSCLYVMDSVHLKVSVIVPFIFDFFYFRTYNYTLYNFVKWNVIDGNSKQFGVNPYWYFVTDTYPSFFNEQFHLLKVGICIISVIGFLGIIRAINYSLFNQLHSHHLHTTSNHSQNGVQKLQHQIEQQTQTYNQIEQQTQTYNQIEQSKNGRNKQKQQFVESLYRSFIMLEMIVMFICYNWSQFLSEHKEHRFLLGIYPLMLVFVVYPLLWLSFKFKMPITTVMMIYPMIHKSINIQYKDNYRKDPSGYIVADYIRKYNENVRPIKSFVDFVGIYQIPYNSHLHIRNGKYMNGHHSQRHFNCLDRQQMQTFINKHAPSHILVPRDVYDKQKDFLINEYGYELIKEFVRHYMFSDHPSHSRFFLENKHVYEY